ncbi:MAG: DUF1996 domain-containing protein [Ilumatobacter sp.]|uniref:DUF1996 domain-containing protein n=1 Tax=Ilumatobacter sp. TaxID=1967498 RepID=UPI0039195DB2
MTSVVATAVVAALLVGCSTSADSTPASGPEDSRTSPADETLTADPPHATADPPHATADPLEATADPPHATADPLEANEVATGPDHEWSSLDGHPGLIATQMQPSSVAPNSWNGILRINCDLSHTSYDDPVVFPGEQGAAHLHRFYGNPDVDHTTTPASLVEADGSTCQGGALNLSSYWMPALLTPTGTGESWDVVPAVVGGDDEAHEVFYYSAGITDVSSVQPIPEGLVMVAGDASATPDDPQDTGVVRWHCQSWQSDDASNPRFSATTPDCTAPDRVRLDLFFPSCWDGEHLDSADHASHMAYPVTEGRISSCPDTHPVAVVRVSYHMAFGVKPDVWDPSTRSSVGWQLSSDRYVVDENNPGGASAHADWMNGWHPEVMQMIVDGCIAGELDCHDGNLGNGLRLSGVSDGTGATPDVVAPGADHERHG